MFCLIAQNKYNNYKGQKGGDMINIAIDGHVGSGKSTLAKGLAKKLGFKVLDTGAIYRGFACAFKDKGYTEINDATIEDFVKDAKVEIFFEGELQHVLVNSKDYTAFLREEEISLLSSKVSPYKVLREKVKQLQREFAGKYNCIMEGRDIGTVVLPNADVKFFITASEVVRAQRRYLQYKDKKDGPSFEEVLQDLRERDYRDEHREVAPLKPASDAIIVDTSNMTLEESIDYCLKIIKSLVKSKNM